MPRPAYDAWVQRCPTCGEENSDRARFCQNCATPLGAPPSASETRKVVTIVFVDVTGSTALGERLDPEALRRVMGRYFDEMSAVIERHGGTVEKFIGDAVMAVFGLHRAEEEDPHRAVRTALEMQASLEAINAEVASAHDVTLEMRIGVDTGLVVVSTLGDQPGQEFVVMGDIVNRAARLQSTAPRGGLALGHAFGQGSGQASGPSGLRPRKCCTPPWSPRWLRR